jgi:hypothetical protein
MGFWTCSSPSILKNIKVSELEIRVETNEVSETLCPLIFLKESSVSKVKNLS